MPTKRQGVCERASFSVTTKECRPNSVALWPGKSHTYFLFFDVFTFVAKGYYAFYKRGIQQTFLCSMSCRKRLRITAPSNNITYVTHQILNLD